MTCLCHCYAEYITAAQGRGAGGPNVWSTFVTLDPLAIPDAELLVIRPAAAGPGAQHRDRQFRLVATAIPSKDPVVHTLDLTNWRTTARCQ